MSISVGKKGFRLNFSKRGVRQTTDLPGKGLYHTSYLFKDSEDEKKEVDGKEERAADADDKPKRRTRRSLRERAASPWGFFAFVLIALFFFYFGADALGLLPPNMVTNLLQALTQWAQQVGL